MTVAELVSQYLDDTLPASPTKSAGELLHRCHGVREKALAEASELFRNLHGSRKYHWYEVLLILEASA